MADLKIPEAPAIEGTTHLHSGKVRDLYRIDAGEHDGRLLMVASDRISAYDFVLDSHHPRQGRDPHPDVAVVVRPARGAGRQPRRVDRRPDLRRRARGRLRAARDVPGRVRGPRLPHRLRPARLPPHRRGLRHRAARRAPGRQPAARADLHPGHARPTSATTTRTSTTRPSSRPSATTRPPSCGCSPWRSTTRRTPWPWSAASSWPTPSSSSAARPRRHDDPRRRGPHPRLPLLAGGRLAAGPRPGVVRQADRARLADRRVRLGPHLGRGAAAPARGGRRAHPDEVRRGVRAADRGVVLTTRAISATVELPVTAEAAFRYLCDPRNRPEWQSSLRSVEVPPDEEPHLGQAWRETTSVGVRPHMETTELVPFRVWTERGTWRGVERHALAALHRRDRRLPGAGRRHGRGTRSLGGPGPRGRAGWDQRRSPPTCARPDASSRAGETTGDGRHDR